MEQGGQSNGGREGERERGKGSRVVLFPGEPLCESMGRTQLVTSDSTISRLITSDYNMHPTNNYLFHLSQHCTTAKTMHHTSYGDEGHPHLT